MRAFLSKGAVSGRNGSTIADVFSDGRSSTLRAPAAATPGDQEGKDPHLRPPSALGASARQGVVPIELANPRTREPAC